MGAWLAGTWGQVWPNLLASVIWAPIALAAGWAYHQRVLKPHFQRLREHQTALHRQSEALLIQHVLGRTGEEEAAGVRPVLKGVDHG